MVDEKITDKIPEQLPVDLNRATKVTEPVMNALRDQYDYHPWDQQQQNAGMQVRCVLQLAAERIIEHVPPCPDRSAALRKLREARMDANSAITHRGKY
jgi:hypothetical protein